MLFSKDDYDYLLNSLSKKFILYEFIDNDYLIDMLVSLMNNGCFEDLRVSSEDLSKDMNPLFNISFIIQNYLYYKICKLCEDDIEVLLTLIEDKRRIINLVLRKLKVEDNTKIDDYIMEVASLYNGVESFDSFVTRYVMATVKGIKFEVEKAPLLSAIKELEITDKKHKKSKKKKTKNKTLESEKLRNTYSNDFVDGLDNNINEYNEVSFYDKVLEKCNSYRGTAEETEFIKLVLKCDLVNKIAFEDDECYKMYFLMRYGFINGTYYSLEDVALICEISILQVITYEKNTIQYLRNCLTNIVDGYEKYLLIKSVYKA